MAIEQKEDGSIVVRTSITFIPGRDDDMIALILRAPKRRLATTIREAMRSGVAATYNEPDESEVDLDGLGEDL